MPDVHAGIGSTVGSVIPTRSAIIPAAVGVDIGCGMNAVRTIVESHSGIEKMQRRFDETWICQLGTLGGDNHFIELCLDEADRVWIMLHSGSHGLGNVIGRYFIAAARKDMGRAIANLPDKDLAYFSEGSTLFYDYVNAVFCYCSHGAGRRMSRTAATRKFTTVEVVRTLKQVLCMNG